MNLFSVEARRDPYPLYRQLRERTPVLHVPGPNLWIVLRHAAVKRVLTDHEAFSSSVSALHGHDFAWLLFMDPPRHTKLRAIISKSFTSRAIAALEPRIRELSRQLLDAAVARGQLDLVADYATPLPLMVIAELLGFPVADWRELARWSETIVALGNTISGTGAAEAGAAFRAADAEMTDYFGRLVRERRARPTSDLLARLVAAEVDGERLDDGELVRFCQLLLAAGTETTTNLIDNAVIALLEHSDQLAQLRADASRIPAALEEVLRHRTPVQAMFRATRREVTLDGVALPERAFVIAAIGCANRDPDAFGDAERFDIAREPNAHLAFGHGIHFCLGAPLSRLEGRIALTDLLARFASLELVEAAWPPRSSFHVLGPASLPLRFTLARVR